MPHHWKHSEQESGLVDNEDLRGIEGLFEQRHRSAMVSFSKTRITRTAIGIQKAGEQ